ncbi:MAG TPA: hypothetical protein VJ964_16310 [Balneolaceae bacterium]|nr:hypothetical protein [Balneolaceae bacterium]
MNWEKVGKLSYQFLLYVIEWGFKICALVAGWFALAASGSLGMRIGSGFASLSFGLRHLFEFPAELKRMIYLVSDYNQMNRELFRETYGAKAVNQFMASLNDGITFLHRITQNLYQHPFASLTAGLVVFVTFYLLARIIRFARQKGRGSWLNRWELRLGNSVFNSEEAKMTKKVSEIAQPKSDKFQHNRFSLKQLLSS